LLGLNNILAKKIKLIPNSILTETVPCEPLDYKDRKNIILVVGRIGAYQKNHELILKSLDMIDNLGDWRIQFVGPIENELDLSQFDNLNNKSIEFMGNFDRERMFQAYAEAKVFLLPSRWEGFSLALLEAAYMGCYIIGTDVGGVLEVTNNGIYGNIIKGDDETNLTKNLTSRLKSLINSDEEIRNLYSDRLSYVRKNFDLEKRLESVEWSING
jgi:glycosyltransferase involved in cell wall biosynthesis